MHQCYNLSTEQYNLHPETQKRRLRPSLLSLVLVLLMLHVPLPLVGQILPPDSGAADRDTVTAIRLDPITVTVSKLPMRPSRAGFAVTVIPEVELHAERPRYALEALRELPGAYVDEATGPGGPAIVRLRGGEEVFTQILMDGVQVNENGGFFDFQGVTLTNVDRIEVARGPQSALYGSSAVSGVVHFLTPSGEPGPLRLGGTLEGGGDGEHGRSFQGNLVARGGVGGVLYSAGGGVTYNRGIYALPHDTWTADGSLRVDAYPSPRLRVTGNARFIGIRSNHPVRDPGVTRAPLDPNARLERDRYVVSARAQYDASRRWTHRLVLSGFAHDFTYIDERDDIEQPADYFVLDADLTSTNDVRRAAAEYVGTFATSATPSDARLAVAGGARFEREDLNTELTGDFGDDQAAFDRHSVAVFADLTGRPHARLDVMLGARAERYEGVGTAITPRGSIVFRVVPDRLSLRAAGGRAYKAPNIRVQFQDDPFIAPNPDLRPETSVSWEGGADVQLGRAFHLRATGFHQDYRNLIRTVPLEEDTRLQSRNVGESRAWGAELDARLRLRPATVVGLEATRTWTEVIDNTGLPPDQYPEGASLPFRPDFIGSAYVRARITSRVELTTRGTYIGSQMVLTERFSGRRVTLDPHVRVDGTLNYQLGERRTLYLRVRNLLDTDYQTAYDRPGIPLTAALGFTVDP